MSSKSARLVHNASHPLSLARCKYHSTSIARHPANSCVQRQQNGLHDPMLPKARLPHQSIDRAGKPRDKDLERDFFLSVLSATTTKRDAKSYLSQFSADTANAVPTAQNPEDLQHISLIKIRATDLLEDHLLAGLARTFSRLGRLGLKCIVIVDTDDQSQHITHRENSWKFAIEQADRVVAAFSCLSTARARSLDSVFAIVQASSDSAEDDILEVDNHEALSSTIRSGLVAVLPPIAYTRDLQRKRLVSSDDVLLTLTRYFAGFPSGRPREAGHCTSRAVLERIVFLDPLGGLPSSARFGKGHVFVNLEQEYDDIRSDLAIMTDPARQEGDSGSVHSARLSARRGQDRHLRNLDTINSALCMLPPSSSALLTTPQDAAVFDEPRQTSIFDIGVQTRRPKNPLIYNLLTDKPFVSSSLPESRLPSAAAIDPSAQDRTAHSRATFIKKGMPLSVVPSPHEGLWMPPKPGSQLFNIDDPQVDFARLLNLIEDSFSKHLAVEKYLERIRNKTAGIIIAGDYEGGAILTWELPPGVADDGSEESRRRMVPYLDKFAVRKRSQGAGGVADIVFSCMVRTCFPHGVCWRSRKNNPVNKWYFERSVGTQKLSDTEWTMFWTTQDLTSHPQRWQDYESVCRSIESSWS